MIGGHILSTILLIVGLLWYAQRAFARRSLFVPSALSLILFALGDLFVPSPKAQNWDYYFPIPEGLTNYLILIPVLALILAVIVLSISGRWNRWIAIGLLAPLLLAMGAAWGKSIQDGIVVLSRVRFGQPLWLVLLVTLPILVMMSFHSLAGLGPVRRWLAMGSRLAIVTFLILSLAELRIDKPNDNLTVLFLVDRSLSIPQEIDPRKQNSGGDPIDERWLRIQAFINESVQKRGRAHLNDQAGVIMFARRPRLIMPPSAVNQLLVGDQMAGTLDVNYTDIAAAIKLGLASFPEGTAKRIVLVSDGNENLGSSEEQANLAKQNGVQIDTVLLAAGYRNENEVLIQSVEAPPVTAVGARLPPIRVLVRNAHPSKSVIGTLELLQVRDGRERPIPILDGIGVIERERIPPIVKLKPGLNSFSFRDSQDIAIQKPDEVLSFTYRALFTPLESGEEGGSVVNGLPGDRSQNNRASTHVIARGQRRVLFLESEEPADGVWAHQYLINRLRQSKYQVVPMSVTKLPQTPADLGVFLTNYDCVVIANVPSELLTNQQEIIRSNTFDQGCGLVVIGGPDSYGMGGYSDTPIEKALPVDCQIKALKAAGKGGLVLIMHASEMADGNKWQKEIAKLAIKKLSPIDMVGMIYYGFNTVWYIPFQTVGEDRSRLLTLVDRMTPGDMPDFDPGLQMAYDTLSDPKHDLVTKHVIIISDGDAVLGPNGTAALTKMSEERITVTTVGVATHGAPEATRMQKIAEMTKGKYYSVTDPRKLPSIYIREARRVSQSFLYEKKFKPTPVPGRSPLWKIDDEVPELYGFIRTTMKPSVLAQMLIEAPPVFEQRFPILAAWQYGLGRSVAFTSDARTRPPDIQGWDRNWAASDMYLKFWEQAVGWAMRGAETGRLSMQTEFRDGKVKVIIEARDERNRPITDLKLEGGVTPPGGVAANGKPIVLDFEQKSGGIYEAEFKAEEAGSYFLNAVAKRDGEIVDSVRSGVTLPYSPEFADLESNTALLRRLSAITGGQSFDEDPESLKKLASSGDLFRSGSATAHSFQPMWYWLIFLAAIGLLFDVGVRRIAIEPAEVDYYANRIWQRLRHREFHRATPEAMSRLKEAKARAGGRIDRDKATKRFEVTTTNSAPPPPGADDAPPPTARKVSPPPPKPTESTDQPESMMERLKRAKRRAQQQREDEDNPNAT